nr:ABC transporter permease [Xanthovirga aplysinae]
MLKNYVKIAFRNLIKHKFYSIINIMGLAVGLTSCMLIFLWVQDELSYDKQHDDLNRLYRVYVSFNWENPYKQANIPSLFAATLKEEFTEVEQAGRYKGLSSALLTFGENSFKVERFTYADSTLFQLLKLNFLEGSGKVALKDPNGIILNKSLAKKIFGKEEALGKILLLDHEKAMRVTGVFEDMPQNTHINFEAFASVQVMDEPTYESWTGFNSFTYVKLREGVSPESLENRFKEEIVRKHYAPLLEEWKGKSWAELMEEYGQAEISYHLEPVKDIHLYSKSDGPGSEEGIIFVYIFSTIALIILIIACINYVNLATARSADRAKEVGMRKVLGAYGQQLKGQFLAESLILSLVAFALALLFVEISLPAFNQLAQKSLLVNYTNNGLFWLVGSGLTLLLAILAGAYPAFYLSSFQPAAVLKGSVKSGRKGGKLRNLLVVMQFGVSIFLIVGTVVIYKQLSFVQKSDPGYDREQILVLQDPDLLESDINAFKQQVLENSLFKAASISGYIPVVNDYFGFSRNSYEEEVSKESVVLNDFTVDLDYLGTYGMEMALGRFFSAEYGSDSTAVVINETAVKKYGLENPIGARISGGYEFNEDYKQAPYFHIIGVVKDFNVGSLREEVKPLVMHLGQNNRMMTFRFQGNQAKAAISYLEQKWKEMAPGQPFNYNFLDDTFDQLYRSEQQTGKMIATFSALAIFIACLGLFGLAAFTAEQRKKEIGVRKVLGSSTKGIVLLLSKDFAKLILISFIIASPIAWYVMNDWLQGFTYRISIGIGVFLIAAGLSFFVAWLTMSFHAIKAATDDPVNSIRYE